MKPETLSRVIFARCSKCGRAAFNTGEIGTRCGLIQPNGHHCDGVFQSLGGAPAMIQRPAPVLTAAEQAALHPKHELPELPREFPSCIAEPEPPPRPVVQPCCATWAAAQQDGTDCSEYDYPMIFEGEDKSMRISGSFMPDTTEYFPPLRFCPWCAAPKLPATA